MNGCLQSTPGSLPESHWSETKSAFPCRIPQWGASPTCLTQKHLCRCGHVHLPGRWLYPDGVWCSCIFRSPTATSTTVVWHIALIPTGVLPEQRSSSHRYSKPSCLLGNIWKALRMALDSLGPLWANLPSPTKYSHSLCPSSEPLVSPAVTCCKGLEPACKEWGSSFHLLAVWPWGSHFNLSVPLQGGIVIVLTSQAVMDIVWAHAVESHVSIWVSTSVWVHTVYVKCANQSLAHSKTNYKW